ncbi:sulfite exporter TauE/SafE family protein [Sulfitobacter sabulilitoris]|uniref:Probable membrane transporter protein n=1 Tax=Sulfitobacter sabulilitoris TaxID=2562655 RepID=A0A5S3PFZ1_9RHOB|nr:sulfite exporter TauE/SafE family protein [Sulfitobacter sabulilitoris]TMM52990.1 sulfite exporter TauE/SafE family protein [Sulfitobacter sabulilitoris]
MDTIFTLLSPGYLAIACSIAVLAGVVKGVVGFAMPMVLISGLTTFIAPDLALAGLILPTLVTNGIQALRQGPHAAWKSVQRFRVFLLAGLVMLVLSAQLVRVLPMQVMLLMIGVPVTGFALLQLSGRRFAGLRQSPRIETAVGGFAGFIGGMSGIWGPPTVAYLTALGTEKNEQMRVQGVIYGLGAVALFGAHIGSGVLRADTLPLSVALVPSAVVGMWIGTRVLDRIDQRAFARATLFVLLVAGLNLVRRAFFG